MFRNYLSAALNNLVRNKLYAAINIVGLAVGFAAAILIGLYVRDEFSYDRWIPGNGDVYRVETSFTAPGVPPAVFASAPFPLAEAMATAVPQVQSYARLVTENAAVTVAGKHFPEAIDFVDPNFFDIIRLPMAYGDGLRAFAGPESVVLSQSTARRYFGTENALGKTIVLNDRFPLVVTGIVEDLPHNSHFAGMTGGKLFVSNKSLSDTLPDKREWTSVTTNAYVRLAEGADRTAVTEEIRRLIHRVIPPIPLGNVRLPSEQFIHARLIRLRDIHLGDDPKAIGNAGAGSLTTVLGFAAIAILIVLIACFNFTNLATAQAMLRAKEVGVRKASGATRGQLTFQFLGEAVALAIPAMVLALALVELLLPAYANFLGRPFALNFLSDWPLTVCVISTGGLTGLLGGIYPALVLSKLKPISSLRQEPVTNGGSGILRNALVTFQFAISIGLGITALVVFAQLRYANHLDLGFNRDNMVIVGNASELSVSARESLMQKLASNSDIVGVTQSSLVPFGGGQQHTVLSRDGDPQSHAMRIFSVATNFFDVYGMKLISGRGFLAGRVTDINNDVTTDAVEDGKNIVINAAAARNLGFAPGRAVGQMVRVGHLHSLARIVGVVADAKFGAAQEKIDPAVFAVRPNLMSTLSVRVKGERIPEALSAIDGAWHSFASTVVIRRYFLDESFDKLFSGVQKEGQMLTGFTLIAIFIASLGLFGLAAFAAQRRTKEIAIRKIFGADNGDIIRLLLWQFSIPVLLANLVAWPLAFFYLTHWLEGYAYRISLSPIFFLVAGFVALLIAWGTIIVHALHVAGEKPAHALRYE